MLQSFSYILSPRSFIVLAVTGLIFPFSILFCIYEMDPSSFFCMWRSSFLQECFEEIVLSLWCDLHTSVERIIYCCCFVSVTQLCLTLCNPMDCSPPGSSVHGVLQARILEWIAMPFSRGQYNITYEFMSELSIILFWSVCLSLCQYHTILITVVL